MNEKKVVLSRKCPICQSDHGVRLGILEFSLFDDCPLSRKFGVVACSKCSFVFYDTPDSADDYALFYRDHYFSSGYTSNPNDTDDPVIKVENDPLAIMSTYIVSDAKICEVGCGRGSLLAKFQKAGYQNLFGVEPSPVCVNYVNEHLGIDVREGTADFIPFDLKFDLFISTHVLEHVLNLKEVVESFYNQLSENGLAYIEVPDIEGYDSQTNTPPLDYITFYEHINHFSIDSLCKLFEQRGFSLIANGRKILDEGSRFTLPVIFAIFRKNQDVKSPSSFHPRTTFDINKVRYWLTTTKFLQNNELEEIAQSKVPVYVWGINLPIQKMLSMSPLHRCNIAGLVDRDSSKQKKTINGMKVQSPEIIKNIRADSVVVFWGGPYRKSIQDDLEKLVFKGKILTI